MNITYNGVTNPSGMLTFSEIPNILKISEEVVGTKAQLVFSFYGSINQYVTGDSQYYVTILGETVSNVLDPSNAVNKRFFIAPTAISTAHSFASALLNCSSLAGAFNIVAKNNMVYMTAKTIGKKFSNMTSYISTNLINSFMTIVSIDGDSYSDFFNSKIVVDIYSDENMGVENHVVKLEKNFYGNECAFNLTPVLATLSEYKRVNKYGIEISRIGSDANYTLLGVLSASTTNGYEANQSDRYLYLSGAQFLMQNIREDKPITLYTCSNMIEYSTLVGSDINTWTETISCKNSANQELWHFDVTKTKHPDYNIYDVQFPIPEGIFNNTYYIDITTEGKTIRFNVIKPLKASEDYQRIYWRNEYGGISFFDFTGRFQESDSVENETYEKNIFDIYDNNVYEKKKIYKINYSKDVKVTSHLMEESGKWIFNSLMNSKKVWTIVNDKTYAIIPKSIEINENEQYNNIYTAVLTYNYSVL